MLQKITWRHYLILGSYILVLNSTLSCKSDIDYVMLGDYIHVNNTDTVININGNRSFKINSKQSHIINILGDGPEVVTEKNYVPPFTFVVITYNDTLCDTLTSGPKAGLGEGILGIDNYTSEKVADRHYKFTYTFTQADIDKAVLCP